MSTVGPKALNAPFTDARSVIVPMMGRVIQTLTTETIETPFVMETGETHEISFTVFPVMGADGELAYIGNISHDPVEARPTPSFVWLRRRGSKMMLWTNLPSHCTILV